MRESGVIVSSKNNTVTVQMAMGEKCEGCNACMMAGPNLMQVEAQNDLNAHTGDSVDVEVSSGHLLGHTLLVFIFPVIMMFVGYFVGNHIGMNMGKVGEGPGILGTFTALFASFILIKIYDTIWGHRDEVPAHVVRVVSSKKNSILND